MKPVGMSVAVAPLSYIDTALSGLRTTDMCDVGLVIRKPKDYTRVIKDLPTGRALRRLLAKLNKGTANAR